MARLDRLTYREVAASRAAVRLRQLLILLLTIVFGVLFSVSVNAQKTSEKNSLKKKHQIFKYKNRAKANHYANAHSITKPSKTCCEIENISGRCSGQPSEKTSSRSLDITPLPGTSSPAHALIREMVALSLSENPGGVTIELAPLLFELSHQQLNVTDINPFLIAVEFALQGRTIVIENHIIKGDQHNRDNKSQVVTGICEMMKEMGVPADRIVVAEVDRRKTHPEDNNMYTLHFKAL